MTSAFRLCEEWNLRQAIDHGLERRRSVQYVPVDDHFVDRD
jgi:hypothetical protein